MDLVIELTDGRIDTDLYGKPTDSHEYLHNDSCHAKHTKRSIGFRQTLRLKRICSHKGDVDSQVKELKNWFSKRGYPQKVLSGQVNRALRSEKKCLREGRTAYEKKRCTTVVTYNPDFKNLCFLIRRNLPFLYAYP